MWVINILKDLFMIDSLELLRIVSVKESLLILLGFVGKIYFMIFKQKKKEIRKIVKYIMVQQMNKTIKKRFNSIQI